MLARSSAGIPAPGSLTDLAAEGAKSQLRALQVRQTTTTPDSSTAPQVAWQQAIDPSVKRLCDVVLGTAGLVVALPILAVIWLVIKLNSAGPAVLADRRLGRFGSPFPCYKFRTMFLNGDQILADYLAKNPRAQHEWTEYKKLRTHDPRVTRVGKWLRALSLDELPQLVNVVRGEMSLVGPRPYLLREDQEMGPLRDVVLSVMPGVTGLWQVSGRNELSFRRRVRLEAWYARHRSLYFDFVLLLKTIRVVLARRGAF